MGHAKYNYVYITTAWVPCRSGSLSPLLLFLPLPPFLPAMRYHHCSYTICYKKKWVWNGFIFSLNPEVPNFPKHIVKVKVLEHIIIIHFSAWDGLGTWHGQVNGSVPKSGTAQWNWPESSLTAIERLGNIFMCLFHVYWLTLICSVFSDAPKLFTRNQNKVWIIKFGWLGNWTFWLFSGDKLYLPW